MEERRSHRIGYMANALRACAWYRCVVPGVSLMKRGDDAMIHSDVAPLCERPPEVFVSQAVLDPTVLKFIEALNEDGRMTVFDLDDEPWAVRPDNPAAVQWMNQEAQELLAAMMRSVQLVTTTTPELAERFRRFNSNVRVLPNMLPADLWPERRREVSESEKLVLGWAGGNAHREDLRLVEDVLHQILDRYPNLVARLAGAQKSWFDRVHERFEFPEPVSIEEYPGLLSTFDIAIAPLTDNRFNEGKSDLKALEYSMVGLPVIASKSASYSRSIRHGESGLLARSAKDWLQGLRSLIESADLRDRMGGEARAWAETRTIDPHIGAWEKAYGIDS